ncbi:hypothetical protein FUT69_02865 [Xylella taiwanensis]|uniref:Uncharacterized protein n=1 Tax=Xylella taiwanensis TaxID=1444770 RepID=Z9JI72_9GAMM|nr:hypothetical protein [Xylella taiwanensis]AXI83935.1 hypothetical protein AB672_08320 [Xylella taiwanensis]EWS77452.1 hypothetical protein AF72_10920 [Xylella taiwanensis]MCD8462292.1 hypothetical protein [Xylella taiwanensis]MCD8468602.1 hypothetical protein [Xylella taiwanensis]MCD8469059.1 hypothetical protein [Xylella taiwanensis]
MVCHGPDGNEPVLVRVSARGCAGERYMTEWAGLIPAVSDVAKRLHRCDCLYKRLGHRICAILGLGLPVSPV